MSTNVATQDRIDKPHVHFENAQGVVADPALSKQEKLQALETLEQDARQLSEAANEGMAGGELSNLHEVLEAKDALEQPPLEYAHGVVRRDLKARHAGEADPHTKILLEHAVAALEALDHAAAMPEPV